MKGFVTMIELLENIYIIKNLYDYGVSNIPNEKGIYTGKVFEYLAARRPILGIGGPPDSVVSQLLLETGAGIHCRDIRSLKIVIRSWYDEYKLYGTPIYKGDWAVIERYSHREMARKFSSLLAEVIDV